MTTIIGFVSQKGGVGKSTLARLVAREYAAAGWAVKIADLDVAQGTSFNWQARRLRHQLNPDIPVERFRSAQLALKVAGHYDLFALDGPPQASEMTWQIAAAADLVVIPTGLCLDDLEPGVLLGHELTGRGLSPDKLAYALCRVGESQAEIDEARGYLGQAGYGVLAGHQPERIAYRRAADGGRALTETRFASLNAKADHLAQAVIDRLDRLGRRRVAAGQAAGKAA